MSLLVSWLFPILHGLPYFSKFTNNPLPQQPFFLRRLMFGPSRLFIFPLESLLSLCWLEKGKKMRALDVKDQQIMTKIKGNETRPKVRRDHLFIALPLQTAC